VQSAYRLPAHSDAAALRRRLSGLVLALAVNLLLLLVLLGLGVRSPRIRPPSDPLVVSLEPMGHTSPSPAPAPRPAASRAPAKAAPLAPPKPRIQLPPRPKPPLDMIVVSREEYAAMDMARLPSASASGGGSAGDSPEAGVGPNGQTLDAAEWARRPTAAELSAYLPRNMPEEGWGEIACRTAPGRRVEDCVELDSYPRLFHLGRAVRDAAWQFRVRPPRKNGREMIGEWVRIHIDYVPK
jgi:protein TonB